MIDKLEGALGFYQQALSLRHERQKVLASNIANADTPNYKARDMDFSQELSRAVEQAEPRPVQLMTTSERHISPLNHSSGLRAAELLYRVPAQPSLDGNTVDMDSERAQFADNAVRYQSSLVMINSRIKSLKSAMQPE
ncbi:flagellar basal body rod protein FlgB [Denitrificimonas sp. JX-1]|uniref:Flagellar basal body rod protein FlgB n=1 Tax=Denitrificimonas halotolerans TaxID=3098930 RepID=A0ABU5GSW6_9GAMM|nr:flagellar basal body rod protein FlgB [Denitrificimonas sp. JX-1]MDY7219702.1 flagellar basal body rod protein FlgB [Denitrificimonas sp. JX-1]